MNTGRHLSSLSPLAQGNRLQRAYHRWAEPHYARMSPELRVQSELIDRFLYSRRGLGAWAGLLAAVVGSALGLRQTGMPWWLAILLSLLLWGVLPLMLLVAWLQPALFSLSGLRVKMPRIVLLALAGGLLGFGVGHVVRHGRFEPALFMGKLWDALLTLIPAVLLTALAIVLLLWGVAQVRRQMLERELLTLKLERERDAAARQAAEVQLRLLQGQIQPHFIFNTLSALQHWVDSGDARGGPLLRSLTAFLRGSTELLGRDQITLAEEAAMVQHYLAIMQARLGGRLQATVEVEPAVAGLKLPPGLLLTLVENAVEHGVQPSLGGATVGLMAAVVNGKVQVRVKDNGAGLAADAADGVGLANCRQRLAHAFGAEATLELRGAPGAGCDALMELPLFAHEPPA